MKHLLHGGGAVGEEEIDALTANARRTNRGGEPMSDPHQLSRHVLVDVGKMWPVVARNHEQWPGFTGWMSMKATQRSPS